jgi:hypothetical protein
MPLSEVCHPDTTRPMPELDPTIALMTEEEQDAEWELDDEYLATLIQW